MSSRAHEMANGQKIVAQQRTNFKLIKNANAKKFRFRVWLCRWKQHKSEKSADEINYSRRILEKLEFRPKTTDFNMRNMRR